MSWAHLPLYVVTCLALAIFIVACSAWVEYALDRRRRNSKKPIALNDIGFPFVTAAQILECFSPEVQAGLACQHPRITPLQISKGVTVVYRCLDCDKRIPAADVTQTEWDTGERAPGADLQLRQLARTMEIPPVAGVTRTPPWRVDEETGALVSVHRPRQLDERDEIAKLQRSLGVPADGIFGPMTRRALVENEIKKAGGYAIPEDDLRRDVDPFNRRAAAGEPGYGNHPWDF